MDKKENLKKAFEKYRLNNVEKYNELQRKYYHKNKENEEWRNARNERARENNKRYREMKKLENPPKPRGRPKKPLPKVVINDLKMENSITEDDFIPEF